MPASNRDLPLSGAVDDENPDLINWEPLYYSSLERDYRAVSSIPRLRSSRECYEGDNSPTDDRTLTNLSTTTSKAKSASPPSKAQYNPSLKRDSHSLVNVIEECSSSIVPTPTRPHSRLPRPTRVTTPIREPVSRLQSKLPARPSLKHFIRQSMTMNDISSLQNVHENIESGGDEGKCTELLDEGDDVTMTSPMTLPQLKTLGDKTTKVEEEVKLKERRFVSTPVTLPSQKKENVVPVRLLRPVSPTQAQTTIHAQAQPLQPLQSSQMNTTRLMPKSRTVGVLSNLRSTFRRSRSSLNIDLTSRKSSASSTSTAEISVAGTDNPELNCSKYVFGFQEQQYWLGRLSSTLDRIHNDNLTLRMSDARVETVSSGTTTFNITGFTATEDDARYQSAFVHLGSLCGDDAAKKSLFTFQLHYARTKGKHLLLPEGGKMEPLLERLGRRVEGVWSRRMSLMTA